MEPTQFVVLVYEALDLSDAQAVGPFPSYQAAHNYHISVVFSSLVLSIISPEET